MIPNTSLQNVSRVKKSVKVMQLFAKFGDIEGQIQCSKQLATLAKDSDATREAVADEGGLDLIVQLTLQTKEEARLAGSRALAVLAANANNRRKIVDQGALKPLASMLLSRDPELQKASANCLVQVLDDPYTLAHESLESSRVIHALAHADSDMKNIDCHSDLTTLMSVVTATPALQESFVSEGGIFALVRISEGTPTFEVRLRAAAALGNLSADQGYAAQIIGAGGLPMIVMCLDHYSEEVQTAALHTLNNFHAEVADPRIHAAPHSLEFILRCCDLKRASEMRLEGMKLIVRFCSQPTIAKDLVNRYDLLSLLRVYAKSHDVENHRIAAQCYSTLSNEPYVQNLLFQREEVDVVYELGESSSVTVQRAVASCILHLAGDEDHQVALMNVDRRSALLFKYAQSDDLVTQQRAAEALSRLAYNPEAAKYLSGTRPIQILIKLATSKEDSVLRFGAMAVSAVAFAGGDSSTNIAENGGLRTLISFGYSKNATMQAQAATAVGSIALNHRIRDKILEEGGIQLLEKLSHSKNPIVQTAALRAKSNFSAMMILEDLAIYAAIRDDSAVRTLDLRQFQTLFDNIRDAKDVDVLRVGLTALANLNKDYQNMMRFQKNLRGVEVVCQFFDPSWEIDPQWEIWREEIVVQAFRCLRSCAHDESSSKMVMQGSSAITTIVKQLNIPSGKRSAVHIEACNTLAALSAKASSVRKRICDEQGLDPLIVLLNSRNEEVQIAATTVLAELVQDEKNAVMVIEEGALSGVLNLMEVSNMKASKQAVRVLSRLSLAARNHEQIMQKLRWPTIAKHLESSELEIRVGMAILVAQLFTSKESRGKWLQQGASNGIIELVIKMAASKYPTEQLGSAKVLAVVAADKEMRPQLNTPEVLDYLSAMSASSDENVKQAAAEVLSNLIEVTDDQDRLLPNVMLSALIALVKVSDGPYSCNAADALYSMSKRYDGKLKIAELGGIKSLLILAASPKLEAQRPAVGCLCELSTIAKNQLEIVEDDGLLVLFGIISSLGMGKDDEVEELALQTIANLAINAENESKIVEVGGHTQLIKLAQGNVEQGDPEAIARKSKIAKQALTNMYSSKLLAQLSGGAKASFLGVTVKDGEVKRICQLLEGKSNTGVQREVARALGNVAGKGSKTMQLMLDEGGVDAVVSLCNSPDAEVLGEAARAVGIFATHAGARAHLARGKAVEMMSQVLISRPVLELPQDMVLAITRALANMCVMPEQIRVTTSIVRAGALHPFVVMIASEKATSELKFEAAKVLAAMNYVPESE